MTGSYLAEDMLYGGLGILATRGEEPEAISALVSALASLPASVRLDVDVLASCHPDPAAGQLRSCLALAATVAKTLYGPDEARLARELNLEENAGRLAAAALDAAWRAHDAVKLGEPPDLDGPARALAAEFPDPAEHAAAYVAVRDATPPQEPASHFAQAYALGLLQRAMLELKNHPQP